MRYFPRLAAVSVLALALAACGSPADEEDAGLVEVDAPAAEAPAVEDDLADAAEADEVSETEEAPVTEAVATPAATASATPKPAPAVAMAPPASFTQCAICHSVEPGQNNIGPSLAGVVGRRSGSVAGFSYSPAMSSAGLTWNEANLNRYLGDPSGVVPGTTMALPGIPPADRAAIIAYLKSL